MNIRKYNADRINLETKNHFMLMEHYGKSYFKNNDCSDAVITLLATVFNDIGPNVDWALRELLDETSRGITGSLIRIIIRNDRVTVQPSYTMAENAEDYAVEIDRNELIRLAREWQELVRNKIPLIYIYCQNSKYFVSETLPEGVE